MTNWTSLINPRIALLLSALTATTALAQTDTKPPPAAAPAVREGLIVHEWGTFTSYSGPSGDVTPFNIHLGDQLPDFVQGRLTGKAWSPVRNFDFEKEELLAEQRMETPVIYFYSDKATDFSVNVRMPNGLITEVYPPVSSATPTTPQTTTIPAAGSSIHWDHVSTIPAYCCDFISLPERTDSHYFEARATKADTLHVLQGDKTFAERFLFYRGIARGDMGLKAKPLGNDKFLLDRSAAGPLQTVFAVEVAGQQVRFSEAHNVKSGDTLTLRKESNTSYALGDAMVQSLVHAGLYEDEAQAMVATWKHLWFGESGTRIMVIMPQATIDQELPLDITPTPKQIKRVFVARLEMLTPERQQWTQDLLSRMNASTPRAEADAINLELSSLGRFQGPATKLAREAMDKHASKSKPN